MIRTRKYKLYPNKQQKERLNNVLEACRFLYNSALQERKEAYRTKKVSISFYDQEKELTECRKEFPEIASVNRQVETDILMRIESAYRAFFAKIKNGAKAGLPRYKGKDRYDSFTYPSQFRVSNNRVNLSKIGIIKFRPRIENIPEIKTCTIKRELDKWHIYFSYSLEDVKKKPVSSKVIGLDLGTKDIISLSNGEKIKCPRFYEKSQKQLKFRQQRLFRKEKGSNRRKKAKVLLSKFFDKIARQRYDFNHKLSKTLINQYDLIGCEDLEIDKMTEGSYYAKSIYDAGWGQLVYMLTYKAEEAGKWVIPVNPSFTSQTCSECGSRSLVFAERTAVCKDCGLIMDRDTNAAINILKRTFEWLGTNHRREGGYELDEARSLKGGNSGGSSNGTNKIL